MKNTHYIDSLNSKLESGYKDGYTYALIYNYPVNIDRYALIAMRIDSKLMVVRNLIFTKALTGHKLKGRMVLKWGTEEWKHPILGSPLALVDISTRVVVDCAHLSSITTHKDLYTLMYLYLTYPTNYLHALLSSVIKS